jgi:predicted AlkP superfamily pyrophosphatase or phosphodiesterase
LFQIHLSQILETQMKKIVLASVLLISVFANAQRRNSNIANLARPKLVVGIVIDQMRWDYLYRYADRYSPNGFKRLLNEGFTCENTLIPYTPTVTAAGHSCVYTGSVPAIHGIMGNTWYRRDLKRSWYCTEDTAFKTIGSTSHAGEMSPSSMWTTTVTDELRMATNFQSKVIGIALKDRGAILPAGHSANGAYWFDNANGAFITSSYYMQDLPEWVKQFNNKKLPDQYLKQNWNTLYPISTYTQSTADDKAYEGSLEDNTFPHITANITTDKYNALRTTPSGNTLTFEMAKAAVEGEKLGQSSNTDFLAVSFSSPDYIGHTFGPTSIEVEDNYLRLDEELAQFLNYLDGKVGKGQYTVFITADHAVAHVPDQLKENKIPAGLLAETGLQATLNDIIEKRFKIKNAVTSVSNYQVYLNRALIAEDEKKIKEAVIERLLENPVIVNAFDMKELNTIALPVNIKTMVANGYNQKLSGDIQFIYKPQFFSGGTKGTTHGSWNPYDSHIPLLWYGWGIKKGKTNRETYMTDISATLSALLHIQMPSGNIGHVIEEVIQ